MKANGLRDRVRSIAETTPDAIALDDGATRRVTYRELDALLHRTAAQWRATGASVAGLLAANRLETVVALLAALEAGVSIVPLPTFFSDAQLEAIAVRAGIDVIVTDDPYRVASFANVTTRVDAPAGMHGFRRFVDGYAMARLAHPSLITFTSGTTASPKGVKLSEAALLTVAMSVGQRTRFDADRRHLCIMPLAVLLEFVGGVLRSVLAGATAVVPDLPAIGMNSICDVDGERLARAMRELGATDAILVPESLRLLLDAFERGGVPPRLAFLGVGGAPVPAAAHERAAAIGAPVFEGYGLTEAASVVALNALGEARAGSVGRPLPHARVTIADDGEVLVRGAILDGYLGAPDPLTADGALRTGDLGEFDEDGFLWLRGRTSDMGITSFARNIAPSWIEGLLARSPRVAQAAVLVEARRLPVAVIVSQAAAADLESDVAAANAELPAYARIERFVVTQTPFSSQNGQSNAFGKLNRAAIERAHRAQLDVLAKETSS